MTRSWRFERAELFDDDYLHFYADVLTDEVSDRQAELLWRLLDLARGSEVLDLACGHGRIANRLAARGALVTGLDATPLFLDTARRDARARGVAVDYVEGDMRRLPWTARFDAAACVFTAFGYFDDDENRTVLAQVRQALKAGGVFWVDVNHLPWMLAHFRDEMVEQRGTDWMIDRNRFDPLLNRIRSERTIIRDGSQRTVEFSIRVFAYAELRDWLRQAGFAEVTAYDGWGGPLTVDSPRMVVVARA